MILRKIQFKEGNLNDAEFENDTFGKGRKIKKK